jgi:DNA-binding transcriptional regulator YhcF (GntR family)
MQIISTSDAPSLAGILDIVRHQPVMISPADYQKLRSHKSKQLMATCERASAYAKSQGLTKEKLVQLLAEDD